MFNILKEKVDKIRKEEFNPKDSEMNRSIAFLIADNLYGFYDEDFEQQASNTLKDLRDNTTRDFIKTYANKASLSEVNKKVNNIWNMVKKEDIDF